MGTGDCFILKFFSGKKEKYKMMIDCGTWSGSKAKLEEYLQDLKSYVNNHVHLLVVTHEHKDHVHGFDVCEDLFTNGFSADRIWMGWTEDDRNAKVKKWKKEFGDKKKALALASEKLQAFIKDPGYRDALKSEYLGARTLDLKQRFSASLNELNELHNSLDKTTGTYVGGLAGMEVVKNKIARNNIEYHGPGTTIEVEEMPGIRFHVLGPPLNWEGEVKVHEGGKGETYDHNKEINEDRHFAAALLTDRSDRENQQPFSDVFVAQEPQSREYTQYNKKEEAWRKIDTEWLNRSGNLALRINSITNNLSLALAIEIDESGEVLLFPGDAEFGSWSSWHNIPWEHECRNDKAHFTEDLLSRTVFYKVAHHLSHNGTAKSLGMDMMTHPNLVAMATLDYSVISKNWKNTMPNKDLIKDLLRKTRGRLLVMNEKGIPYGSDTLSKKLEEARHKLSEQEQQEFEVNVEREELYIQYTLRIES